MKKFLKIFPAQWRDIIATVLTAVAILGAITFGWWYFEWIIVVFSPKGGFEWGFTICPPWLGVGSLAVAITAIVIREKFFPPDY